MKERTVLVLGGGIGGVVAARSLRRRLDGEARVVLVDRTPTFAFAPSFMWVMAGARRPEQVTAELKRLGRSGVEVRTGEIVEIDVEQRKVLTMPEAIAYDRLVVALGARLAPEDLPGFSEAATNVYTLEGAAAAGRALREFDGGRVVVFVSRLPYKCPAAPYETALLAEAVLRRRGIRGQVTIDIFTPEPFPMPTAGPVMGEALKAMLAERGIGFHPQTMVDRIDAGARALVLAGGERVGYDLLLGVPPHRAPDVVRHTPLAAESGFIPVDAGTLATGSEDVYAIGDVTAIPIAGGKFLPKAGVFAEAEADVVAHRISDEIRGRAPSATFDGKGGCFIEMGNGVAAYANGNFYAPDAPAIHLHRPGRRWHLAKVAFERYWMRRWL